jgi:hypothetical protein
VNPVKQSDAAIDLARRQWLESHLGGRISLTWTDNRTSIVSVTRRSPRGYQLRLHRMFQAAPEPVWQALVAYIRQKNRAARQVVRTYIQQQQALIRQTPAPRRPVPMAQAQGQYVDLAAVYHHLNRQYFHDRVQADIMWMRMSLQRQRASIRFGVYDRQQQIIRIHRRLDQPFVPRYFVESIVYHEMLHELIPATRIDGRWRNHPPAFQQAERNYPHYHQARKWERENLHRLLA